MHACGICTVCRSSDQKSISKERYICDQYNLNILLFIGLSKTLVMSLSSWQSVLNCVRHWPETWKEMA